MGFHHETERLVMRDWQEGDSDRFYEAMNTPAVMKWLGGVQDRATWDAAHDRIQSYQRDFGFTFWILERKDNGELIGFCGLKRINYEDAPNKGDVEIGWRLRESAWGKGYAKEAAAASLDLAFDRFGAEEVIAVTVGPNEASWGLMLRLGMTERPELAYDDRKLSPLHGPVRQWAISKSEWQTHSAG